MKKETEGMRVCAVWVVAMWVALAGMAVSAPAADGKPNIIFK